LTAVIGEVKASPRPIILFIDEAHTLIGAGNTSGGSDAANLLKPALARGELRTIAATTWSEYKKYFEKDPALSRRFQLVKVEEPSREAAIDMMRGLSTRLQASHGVHVRDDAVVAAVELSQRYIAGRLLPDKAVDLLDTCAARVKLALSTEPARVRAAGSQRRVHYSASAPHS
jgi:type VI secretion system protein VasG